jgi:hypothetical protein
LILAENVIYRALIMKNTLDMPLPQDRELIFPGGVSEEPSIEA